MSIKINDFMLPFGFSMTHNFGINTSQEKRISGELKVFSYVYSSEFQSEIDLFKNFIEFISLVPVDLSIVIPVYNEEGKILKDLAAASAFLSSRGMKGELIVVSDGSKDRTIEEVRSFSPAEGITWKVLDHEEHTGKGHAVKSGIMKAGGEVILFIDSGNCIPYDHIDRGLELLKSVECQIAHASRYHRESLIIRPKGPFRQVSSFLFRRFIRIWLRLPQNLKDTQCGLKIYRKEAAHALYSVCQSDGFMFDVEIILRAGEKGYKIMEFPVEWSSDPDSRLSPGRTFLSIIGELARIRRSLRKDP